MAIKSLVIVESPTKAKTIRKFLPKEFQVEASMGHIRDLPQSAADIPAKLKKEEWAKIGVNVEKDFEPLYVIPKGKSKIISELKKKMADADVVYLATDEDREGESISWHLVEVLKPKIPVKRMVFHEITKAAIQRSLNECREIDFRLVRAQETRRILDRLVGYTLSPLIWKKIAFGLSAGRVQSVALRLIVDRERERMRFKSAEYWDLAANLSHSKIQFNAKLHDVNGVRLATGKDFDETTGRLAQGKENLLLLGGAQAKALVETLKKAAWKVLSVEEKPTTARPTAPFITSTLQQEGNRKLGLSARDTMRVAQSLYEEGLITYMRTDSPFLSNEAIQGARTVITELYGAEYLSPEVRQFTSKSKSAQEAHEAIRPAGTDFVHPKDTGLTGRELALYELIWKRTVASQMAEAKKLSVQVKLKADESVFYASGSKILFPGFLRAYVEGTDDPDAALEDREIILPDLKVGDAVQLESVQEDVHETKPPARFTEASLVQMLEKEGIGRPSTYASIIGTIGERGYVRKVQNSIVPTFTGFAVTQLLEKNFEQLVNPGFTSKMESSLDDIAGGTVEWLPYLKGFYLGAHGLLTQVKAKDKTIDANESRTIVIPHLKNIDIKVGRYGAYLVTEELKALGGEEEEIHASIPEDLAPADLSIEKTQEIIEIQKKGPQPLGIDPVTGEKIYVKSGRFGPYVQAGENPPLPPKEAGPKKKSKKKDAQPAADLPPKPKRASIPKGVDPKQITLEQALRFLSLPKTLGLNPASNLPIVVNLGRFGPYVAHNGEFRSLKKDDDVYTVTLDRALAILAEPKKVRGGNTAVKEFGPHPQDGKAYTLFEGKYGLYVKHGKVNATVPKEMKAEEVTPELALEYLASKGKK